MGIFGNAFSGWHALIILAVVVLLFGAAKLPQLAKSVGQSMKIFRDEVKTPSAQARAAEPVHPADPTATSGSAETPPKL